MNSCGSVGDDDDGSESGSGVGECQKKEFLLCDYLPSRCPTRWLGTLFYSWGILTRLLYQEEVLGMRNLRCDSLQRPQICLKRHFLNEAEWNICSEELEQRSGLLEALCSPLTRLFQVS